MSVFGYIIYSSKVDVYYKGESFNPYDRLISHNSNLSTYTSGKGPWKLVYIEELDNITH